MKCNSNDSLHVWSGWGGGSDCRGVIGGDGYRIGLMGGGRGITIETTASCS